MRKITLLVAVLLLTAIAAQANDLADRRQALLDRETAIFENVDDQAEGERLNALIGLYFELVMLEFPEFATFIGYPEGQDRWTDGSVAAVQRREAENRRSLEVVASIDREALEGVDRLNYDLLLDLLKQQVEEQRFPTHDIQITQLDGVQQDIAQLFSIMPSRTAKQYNDILSRLRG